MARGKGLIRSDAPQKPRTFIQKLNWTSWLIIILLVISVFYLVFHDRPTTVVKNITVDVTGVSYNARTDTHVVMEGLHAYWVAPEIAEKMHVNYRYNATERYVNFSGQISNPELTWVDTENGVNISD